MYPSFRFASPRFRAGRIFVTPAALKSLQEANVSIFNLLLRHICGDWGDICESDCQQNELSLAAGLRLLSSYSLLQGIEVWVVTEWDRSSTTILLPDDN